MIFFFTNRSSSAPASWARTEIAPDMKIIVNPTTTSLLKNIEVSLVEVAKADVRERPPLRRNLEPSCYRQMAARLRLRKLGIGNAIGLRAVRICSRPGSVDPAITAAPFVSTL